MESSPTSALAAATRLKFVGGYKTFSRQILEADIRRLKKLYRYYGFFKSVIFPFSPKTDLQVLAQRNSYRKFDRIQIRLRICEGPQAIVRKRLISWTPGKPAIPNLEEKLPLLPNQRFQTPQYKSLKSEVKGRLLNKSHALARVKGLVLVSRDRLWVDIRLWVRPGPKCVFGKFRVYPEPNAQKRRVSRRLIEKFISYSVDKNELYTTEKLTRIQSSLFALGVFRVVNVKPDIEVALERAKKLEMSGQVAQKTVAVPINIEVREDLFQLIKLGFGFVIDGQRNQLEGTWRWTFLHFFGGFREFGFQFNPGWAFLPDIVRRFDNGPEITASTTFKQPIFMDRKAELGLRVLYRRAEEIGSADFQTVTPSIWFSRPIWGKLTGRLSYNLEMAFGVQNPLTLEREDYVLSYLELQVALDLRDNPLIPTRGTYFALTVQQAFGGTFTYTKALADLRQYFTLPFHRNFRPVLAMRAMYGVMTSVRNEASAGREALPYSLAEILRQSPVTQRFFSGGANSVRGWTARYLGPLTCRIQEKVRRLERQEDTVVVGGRETKVIRTIRQDSQRTIPVEPERVQRTAKQLVDKVTLIGNSCRAAAARVQQSRFQDQASRKNGLPQDGTPGVVLLPLQQQLQVVPTGGQQMYEAAVELRVPLRFIWSSLSAVVFVDVGAVQVKAQWEDLRELVPNVSVGGGLRLNFARIGALRFDLAFRLNPDNTQFPLQQGWQFHFSFGEAF